MKNIFDKKEELMCCLVNYYLGNVLNKLKFPIVVYGNTRLSWEDTHYLEFNYSLSNKIKKHK